MPFIMERGMLLGLKARAEGTLGNRPALYTAAAVGWVVAVLGVLAFFLSRRGWWPWLLLPLVVAYLIFRPTGDVLAAAVGFISLGLVILGGLAFRRKGWPSFLAVGSFVLLVLLFSADAYLTFGFLIYAGGAGSIGNLDGNAPKPLPLEPCPIVKGRINHGRQYPCFHGICHLVARFRRCSGVKPNHA